MLYVLIHFTYFLKKSLCLSYLLCSSWLVMLKELFTRLTWLIKLFNILSFQDLVYFFFTIITTTATLFVFFFSSG